MDEAKPFKSPTGRAISRLLNRRAVSGLPRCASSCAAAKDIAKNNCFAMSVIALPRLDPGIDRAIR